MTLMTRSHSGWDEILMFERSYALRGWGWNRLGGRLDTSIWRQKLLQRSRCWIEAD